MKTIPRETYIRNLQTFVDLIGKSTRAEEIFIVVNDDFWWRLFWNPITKKWQTTIHKNGRWENRIEVATKRLKNIITENEENILVSKGFEHKTSSGINAYILE